MVSMCPDTTFCNTNRILIAPFDEKLTSQQTNHVAIPVQPLFEPLYDSLFLSRLLSRSLTSSTNSTVLFPFESSKRWRLPRVTPCPNCPWIAYVRADNVRYTIWFIAGIWSLYYRFFGVSGEFESTAIYRIHVICRNM